REIDLFAQKESPTEGPDGIAQRSHWDDSTHAADRKKCQKDGQVAGQKRQAQPRPVHLQRDKNGVSEGGCPEIANLAYQLHGMRQAQLAASAADHRDQEQRNRCHGPSPCAVLGDVRPITKTPRQITRMPSHLVAETRSPSTLTASHATTPYWT